MTEWHFEVGNQLVKQRVIYTRTNRRWIVVVDEDDGEIMGLVQTNCSKPTINQLKRVLFQAERYSFDTFVEVIQQVDEFAMGTPVDCCFI